MKKFLSLCLAIMLVNFNSSAFAIVNELEITKTQIPLNSKLKKRYSGYEYVIQNNDKKRMNIVNAQILNGNDGAIAYNMVEQGSGGSIGTVWAFCGPIGLFTLGIGWAVGIIATPIAWFTTNKSDRKANNESISYTNIVPIGHLQSGEMINVKTLVPIGSMPQIKLSILDEKTKEIYSIVK